MRILHASDVHGACDELTRLVEEHAGEVDVVVVTGDIECLGSELKPAVDAARSAGARFYAVTGNLDDTAVARGLEELGVLVEGRLVEDPSGYIIAGIGGREPIANINRVRRLLEEANPPPEKLIVVAHHPPYGACDVTFTGVHAGLIEARRLVEEWKPRLYLCGHIHEARGVARVGPTLVVNAGPLYEGHYAVIDVEEGRAFLH